MVFGGSGSIGRGIVMALLQRGAMVEAVSSNYRRSQEILTKLKAEYGAKLEINAADVTKDGSMYYFGANLRVGSSLPLHGIVYAVGNCPPAGFDQVIGTPLTQLHLRDLADELDMHVVGLLNVAKLFESIERGSAVVVIGSAVTRVTDEQCPSWLYAGQYATAKAAQAELIKWLRRDPVVKEKKILIHRLAPAAVDTPFHQGCKYQPPAMLSVEEVAQRVIQALESDVIVDEMILPSPQSA